MLLCKDRNFKANHNAKGTEILSIDDVCYSAKIGILKQITTERERKKAEEEMFVTLQR